MARGLGTSINFGALGNNWSGLNERLPPARPLSQPVTASLARSPLKQVSKNESISEAHAGQPLLRVVVRTLLDGSRGFALIVKWGGKL